MFRRNRIQWIVLGMSLVAAMAGTAQGEQGQKRRGVQIFYRMVGADNNAPILPKTESVWTQDRQLRTGNTGMADEGFTEYPFAHGMQDFTFSEAFAIYPRIVSDAKADESRVNTADMVIDHVYQPDGCVWGLQGREIVQTFTATKTELVSVSILMASEHAIHRAALVEGGPGGIQIGPSKPFESGSSMTFGTARWLAGQAPMVPGRIYGIRIWREDGKPFSPFLHSLGNAYAGGMAYVDGRPVPESDLAMWILEQPEDVVRALVDGVDSDGWAYNVDQITFVPRTENVRLITVSASPVDVFCCDLVGYVYNDAGELIAGPKGGVACAKPGTAHTTHWMYDKDELPVSPGQRYHVRVQVIQHREHTPLEELMEEQEGQGFAPRDLRIRVYGDSQPGMLPAIYNLAASHPLDKRLKLTWSASFPAPTVVTIRGDGMEGAGNKCAQIEMEPGETETEISVWPGHTYTFDLLATGPTGMVWRTPTYQVRMPRTDEIEAIFTQEPYPKAFVPLAPPSIASVESDTTVRYRKQVELVNADFEEGLEGWVTAPEGVIDAPDVRSESKSPARKFDIATRWGDRMAGFTHVAGEQREQVFQKSTLAQRIVTEPGHIYLLTAMAYTSVTGGPRGDTRVRLCADPAGGDQLEGGNSTQWFCTDEKWHRFTYRFTALSNYSTVGFGFFRWRDLDEASAYVDHVCVYDLGPAPLVADDPAAQGKDMPTLALTDPKMDGDEQVEAFLHAPPGYVITGIGSRAHYDNITTMWLRVQPLMSNGKLGEPEELRTGWEPGSQLEAQVELPAGYVATGFGAGIAPEWDVKRFGVWARPLNPDGTFGEEELFRGGSDRQSGFEKEFRCEQGRVLTGAGLNCMLNDVNKIKASSAEVTRSATNAK